MRGGLFYLAMRRGLDYLYDHPDVHRSRLAVTGLSGGGWQTIVLSVLDERVKCAVPVAGFSSLRTRVEVKHYGDIGDIEQVASDVFVGRDYTHLVAMVAPRPMLLQYNAEDDCCFRAPLVKPLVFDDIRPFFRAYGKDDDFQWHENLDPSTHNYQLDNRLQAYRFLSKEFGMPEIKEEIPAGQELKSFDELKVGLPTDNLTILALARKMGRQMTHPPIPADAESRASWASSEGSGLRKWFASKPSASPTLGRLPTPRIKAWRQSPICSK